MLSGSPILEVDSTTTLDPFADLSPQGLLVGWQGETTTISDLMRADLCVHPPTRRCCFNFKLTFLS